MTNFIKTPHGSTIAYNQIKGKKTGIVFLSGFGSDMQGKKALFIEKWAKDNDHSFLRFDYSGHGLSSGELMYTCFSDWYNDTQFLIKKVTQGKQLLVGSSMGGWIMLMLAKRIPNKIHSMIGLAPAPDFPKTLIWDKMDKIQRVKLVKEQKIKITNKDGSNNEFSYKLIKNSFKNLVLKEPIKFKGDVYLFHGMKDYDVPYTISIDIINNIICSKNTRLLLDKEGRHRLSEINQLTKIKNIISEIL
ncbi:alpha/beta hydrolase [Alphaproteobacteria bacterium]|nr:alpha/beta hydrolase [Alphaproteobacteria bacterium]